MSEPKFSVAIPISEESNRVIGSQCLETTWYLQCDLQFYIVALAVIIPLYRKPGLGALINIGMFRTLFV